MTRDGRWDLAAIRGFPRLRGQTLGLVGFGKIARTLVLKAQGFGLRVLAYTPRLSPGERDGVELTNDLDRLLGESDYVSVHAPATADSRGLIGEAQLRRMKPTAFLINTSRGALVDEAALERALSEGWIAGAALDVLSEEPPPPNHPILRLNNVIVTPHAAFYSEDAIADLQMKAAQNVATALRGEVPATLVNPGVRNSPAYRLGR
jgi:D-3-phosphoglycerate dehydrogenase